MLTRAQKEKLVEELREKFERATSLYVADFVGLDVASVEELRRKLRAEGQGDFEYHVTKNTLARRAAAGSPVEVIEPHFRGPTAIAFSYGDPVRLAKLLMDYAKQHDAFEVRVGLVEGQPLEREQVAQLATLPSLEALRARIVGLIQAPATKVVQVLAAPGAQLARLVEARRKQLEEAGTAS